MKKGVPLREKIEKVKEKTIKTHNSFLNLQNLVSITEISSTHIYVIEDRTGR